ncbi:MAG: carboxylesterase/lipase family protein [Angustibacter sp.]
MVATAQGRVAGVRSPGLHVFKGIPYAAAPEGPLRFDAPQRRAPWPGVLACTRFAAAAPQPAPAPGAPPAWRPADGLDCLSLNVWSPDVGAQRLPVMVWIHGGLWKHGAPAMAQYDGAGLARAGVVVVTIAYRLGFEGFGHLDGAPDNRGLLDQVAALQWVRDNIGAFGGDPDNVTVFGQSAGAASVVYLAGAPAARGLFRRAVAQSVPDGVRTVEQAREVTRAVSAAAGAPATLEALAALPPGAIVEVLDAPLSSAQDGSTAFGPVVDGDLVPGPPWTALEGGRAGAVDLVCGFTREEFRGMAPTGDLSAASLTDVVAAVGLDEASVAAYRDGYAGCSDDQLKTVVLSDALVRVPTLRVAEAHALAGGRTWLYEVAWGGSALGAAHGIDVLLVLGNSRGRYAARFLGEPPDPEFAPLSARIQRSWTRFASHGDPGWPAYDVGGRWARRWGVPVADVRDPLSGSRAAWASVRGG